MKIKVTAKGRNQSYDATGIYDGKRLCVLQGSRISSKTAAKLTPIVTRLRNDKNVVTDDNVLLQDVEFRSASTAATFVVGNIANGMRIWKNEDGDCLGSM